jgi:methionine synthase II (cobalamin-independent)
MLWLMNSGKMPSPISNSLIGVMGAKDTKAINSVFEIYEILKKLAIDPDQETLTELFEYWDTAKVLKLFNLYSYAINTGKSTVNEAYLETVEEVNAEAKN